MIGMLMKRNFALFRQCHVQIVIYISPFRILDYHISKYYHSLPNPSVEKTFRMHSVWSGRVYNCIALKHLLWRGHFALMSCPSGCTFKWDLCQHKQMSGSKSNLLSAHLASSDIVAINVLICSWALWHFNWYDLLMFISRRPLCHDNYTNSNKRQEVDQLCSFADLLDTKMPAMKIMSASKKVRKLIMSAHLTPFSIFKLPQAPGERSHPFCCFSFSEANLCQSAHILEYVSYSIIHILIECNMYSTHVTLYTRRALYKH